MTIVDFTVTMAGLEDQLLGKLILKEKHELEEQRQQLLEEVQSYKKKIKQLEDDLLFRLSNSQGNLLDDTELIDVLAVTKQTAQVRARGREHPVPCRVGRCTLRLRVECWGWGRARVAGARVSNPG